MSTWQDAVELMLAGSAAVQIGTALFGDPYAPLDIVHGLEQYLNDNGIASVTELTGTMQPWES